MPLTHDEIVAVVKEAEDLVACALPLGAVDSGYRREREEFRARAFTEVLRLLLSTQPA